MDTQWFLGGNTGSGFVSRFGNLNSDPRIQNLIVLKGGPGCGKSTFMKKLRETARQLGADTESYLCSSDPDSLDGLLIVPLGLAFVDGTSPHVTEPALCGCDGSYLNLGCFYDADGLREKKEALRALKEENAALYPAAYAHLRAAGRLRDSAGEALMNRDRAGLFSLSRTLLREPAENPGGSGTAREVFLHGFTPKGELRLYDTVKSLCSSRIGLIDPYGVSAPLLMRAKAHYQSAGYDVISVLDPLRPDSTEAVLIPQAGLSYELCAAASEDWSLQVQLSRYFTVTDESRELLACADRHIAEAGSLLQKAKALHDEIEALYRPYVSFEGLDLLTEEYRKKLKSMLLSV